MLITLWRTHLLFIKIVRFAFTFQHNFMDLGRFAGILQVFIVKSEEFFLKTLARILDFNGWNLIKYSKNGLFLNPRKLRIFDLKVYFVVPTRITYFVILKSEISFARWWSFWTSGILINDVKNSQQFILDLHNLQLRDSQQRIICFCRFQVETNGL